jgi:hypothetical protein
MNRIISTAVAAILIGILAVGQSATATAKTRRYSAQPWQSYSYSSDQSWRLYPYYNAESTLTQEQRAWRYGGNARLS